MFRVDPSGASLFKSCPCAQQIFAKKLCEACLRKLSQAFYPRSVHFYFQGIKVLAMSRFEHAMKNFIYEAKKSSLNGLTYSQLSLLKTLVEYWTCEIKALGIEALVQIPGHPLRSMWQSDLPWFISAELEALLKIKKLHLIRRKTFVGNHISALQKNLKKEDRERFVSKQYFVDQSYHQYKGLKVLLVDDVFTTGSTLRTCASLLRAKGVNVQAALVLAKVERENYG